MKLVSFAVVSFLAATASAGFSANLGNADYNIHQLEKRDMGKDIRKKLEEEIERGQKHYRENKDRYQTMKGREKRLKVKVFQVKLNLAVFSKESQPYGLKTQHVKAQSEYEKQRAVTFEQYKLMMDIKARLYRWIGELSTWVENQQKLKDHNRKNPRNPLGVTSRSNYNKEILARQISTICGSIKGLSVTRDGLKSRSSNIYEKLITPGSNKVLLRGQYTKVHEDLVHTKETVWMNDVFCAHMTELHKKLFGAQK
ncbi:hypothetical protein BASA61_000985 [Batrachochytrium salamandrivorans]|nr:hypothetical protein BASA62_007766 [Batrachochytrium salamandrivorans]KAH6602529.1 hypothetical protein BASA61_000985 [Batrachochytrium salamandrivorans]KAH9246861.1 hypothetical protein BASA81_015579 [Batrachochytrium salamandrivorans]